MDRSERSITFSPFVVVLDNDSRAPTSSSEDDTQQDQTSGIPVDSTSRGSMRRGSTGCIRRGSSSHGGGPINTVVQVPEGEEDDSRDEASFHDDEHEVDGSSSDDSLDYVQAMGSMSSLR